MKSILSAFTVSILLQIQSYAQPAPDMECEAQIFYGLQGTEVHRLQIGSSAVTDLGVLIPSMTTSMHSLAFGYDIIEGSTNRTFYSSSGTGFGPYHILRYSGSSWEVIHTDSIIYHNAGGHGRFIYFQHAANNDGPNDQSIARLMPDGSLTTIFNDTTLRFSVADISVDSLGNIYCFRGPAIGNTTEVTVLDSTGQIIDSFATDLNDLSTLYGSIILNGTHYLGHGTTNGQFFPLMFSGNTANLASALPYNGNGSFKDLANCHEQGTIHTAINYPDHISQLNILITPGTDQMVISGLNPKVYSISIIDMNGRVIFRSKIHGPYGNISISELAAGVYHVQVRNETGVQVRKIVIENSR